MQLVTVQGSMIFCDLTYNGTFVNNSEQQLGLGTGNSPAWTEQSDIQGWHAVGAKAVIPTIRGRYTAVSTTGWGSGTTGARMIRLRRNGSGTPSAGGVMSDISTTGIASGTPGSSLVVSGVLMNGTSDYFDVTAFQNQGAAINLDTRLVVRYEAPPVGP